ncbi:MAG: hypothetical protein U0326_25355 [Polyangiales bacterium]
MTAPQQAPRLKTMRIIWGALCFSVVLYPMILVAAGHAEPSVRQPESSFIAAITVVALVVAALSVVMPKLLFPQMARGRARLLISEDRAITDQGQHGFRDVASSVLTRTFNDPVAAENAAFGVYFTRLILELALAEAVANFGFVLAFLGLGLKSTAPFFAVALVLQLARYPTRDTVLRAFEDALGARFPGPRTE